MKKITKLLNNRSSLLAIGSAVLLAGSAVAFSLRPVASEEPSSAALTPISLKVNDEPISRDGKLGISFAPVVKKVAPSVVQVDIKIKARQASGPNSGGFDHPFFRRFFGDQFAPNGPQRQMPMPQQRGMGSGVIVTEDGYILTNNHVVENADEVKVSLQDGREFTAKVVGKDPKTDVAVLKVEAKDLPCLEIANSDQIEVGDIVLAVGNPFGIGQTVTMGMVSATGRATLGLDYEDFIQTDAAINPGNSGGALVDSVGRLVGINTAILSRSGGNQGIGFAIPANLAREIMESLVKYGKVTRGYLGVMIQNLTPALAKEFNMKDEHGVLIGDVLPDGSAAEAGLQSGDVVVSFNGEKVSDSRQLKLEVARVQPGTVVPVNILREGKEKTIKVTLKTLPGSEEQLAANDQTARDDTLSGVTVTDLDRQVRREMAVPDHIKGALVTEVEPGSAASEAGLKPGDVIVEINRNSVGSAADAVKMTEKQNDKTTLLRVWSKEGSRYVVVDERAAG